MKKFVIPGKVRQVKATILAPENAGLRLILNACSVNGKFETPLDNILTKKWARVKQSYKEWYATQHNFKPGLLNTTAVSSDTWVVNMLVKDKDDQVSLDALKQAVKKLSEMAKYERASLHTSTLLIAEVPQLQELLLQLAEDGINCYFYEEPKQ